jgi:tetratricopeptide (TPR) repeat protein/DNA-binding SARP family transcriptional activator
MTSGASASQVEVGFLGAFNFGYAGSTVEVGGPLAQAVLVGLLRWPNTVVDAGQLINAVWGTAGGASADSLYHYISGLRKALAATGLQIEGRLPGYRIRLDPKQVDAHRFNDLIQNARTLGDTEPEEAIRCLRLALSLWRGPRALPGLSAPGARLYAAALDSRRLDAEEDLAQLELARGNVAQVLDRLWSLRAAHPDRTRLTAVLMRALQATGRAAEAVALSKDARRGGPAADQASQALRSAGQVFPSGSRLPVAGGAVLPVSPFQLPAPTVHFTGRDSELERLLGLWPAGAEQVPATMVAAVVAGMGGIGKTALVVHAAHRLAHRFPAGVLFTELRGFTPDSEPTAPEAVLDTLLRGLGVPSDRIPPGLDARVALYRSVLAGRRALVVLDNAATESQVRPLLPSTPGCMVLVTSRNRLAGLDDAEHLMLDVLDPGDAIALFVRVAGDRAADAGQQAIEDVVELCGYLPLAIRTIAARLRISRGATLASLLAELCAQDGRLAALDDGDRSIARTLAVSYRHLPATQQLALRRLGMHTGPDVDVHAAAALLDLGVAPTRGALTGLEAASLLDRPTPERFAFHDLTRAYATRCAQDLDTEADRQAALTRLFDYYLHTTARANRFVMPYRYQIPLDGRASREPGFDNRRSALEWLDTERLNLTAVCRIDDPAFDSRRWQLAYLLRDFFFLRKHLDAWVETHQLALAGCKRTNDRMAEARTRNNLGRALLELGRRADAAAEYERARVLFEDLGDGRGLSDALVNQATILRAQGNYEPALRDQRTALDYYRRSGATRSIGITLRAMALSEAELGRLADAARHGEEALAIALQQGTDIDAAQALNTLGLTYSNVGDDDAALAAHRQAIEFSRSCGSSYEEANALHHLGRLAARAGDPDLARRRWAQALELFRVLAVPRAQEVLADLATLPGE